LSALYAITTAICAAPALAGPPYLTDDPQPTDRGHWEIYNFVEGDHLAGDLDGEAGLDLNYGAAKDVQLTAVLPLGFDNPKGFRTTDLTIGGGVIELAAKYKVLHQADNSWMPDVSLFPRVFVPTDHRFGARRVNLFLPAWAEKDFGPWQLFGGGGYQINSGPDNRNFWQGGVALNRTLTGRLSMGVEVFGQTRDSAEGHGFTTLDVGLTYKLMGHWSVLASAGPTLGEHGANGQVFYTALKADY
jgi:hypothetical protein